MYFQGRGRDMCRHQMLDARFIAGNGGYLTQIRVRELIELGHDLSVSSACNTGSTQIIVYHNALVCMCACCVCGCVCGWVIGKTTFLEWVFDALDELCLRDSSIPKSILVVSARVSFSIKIAGHFENRGLRSYQDLKGMPYDQEQHPRVVFQLESLVKIDSSCRFGLLIWDEVRSLLAPRPPTAYPPTHSHHHHHHHHHHHQGAVCCLMHAHHSTPTHAARHILRISSPCLRRPMICACMQHDCRPCQRLIPSGWCAQDHEHWRQ